jgi:hypothetical protein
MRQIEKRREEARCSSERMIRASVSHRKQDTSCSPNFFSFFFQLSATFLPSHFCEPNRRAALSSASSVAALHFLVTSLVYQICSIPLVSGPHSSQHRWPLDAVSPRDTLVASDPKKGLSAGLGTQPRQAATFAFCLVLGWLCSCFPFSRSLFFFPFGLRGSGLGWAPRLGFPPLFRFYPHGSAAINRNGARRALIGATRMAVRSRERRVAYESAGPNPLYSRGSDVARGVVSAACCPGEAVHVLGPRSCDGL